MAAITTKEALLMSYDDEPATDSTIYKLNDHGEALRRQCCKYFGRECLIIYFEFLTDRSVNDLLEKFDQLWTELDDGTGGIIKDGSNEGYSYEEMSGT